MEHEILDAISAIVEQKRESRIVPTYALLEEIHTKIGRDPLPGLRTLWMKGKIGYHRTLNSFAYYVQKDKR